MGEKEEANVARLLRENEALRKVACSAARLRRIGQACDRAEENMEALSRDYPEMTRSATGLFLAATAYETALRAFDETLLACAEVFARDPFAEDLALLPSVPPPSP